MSKTEGGIKFDPVNMGQALGVLADVVGSYISAVHTAALADDRKKSAQLNLTMFLHSLCMRSKDKAETADLLDIISAGLREAAAAEAGDQGTDPATRELFKPAGNDGVVNAGICFNSLLLVDGLRLSPETVESWTQDQMDRAYDWAIRVHLRAGDNDDVFVPERPDFIPISARAAGTDS